MGLSFHYRGRIREFALIDALVSEVSDVCESLGWIYEVQEAAPPPKKPLGDQPPRYTPEDVKGITFSPPECEPVILTFLPDGQLVSWIKLIHYDPLTNDLGIEWNHTKTQYAGPETHMAVLKLLHHLREKYFSSFELNDEGEYWDSWDEARLRERFGQYQYLLNKIAEALSDFEALPGESPESLVMRIERLLRKRLENDPD